MQKSGYDESQSSVGSVIVIAFAVTGTSVVVRVSVNVGTSVLAPHAAVF